MVNRVPGYADPMTQRPVRNETQQRDTPLRDVMSKKVEVLDGSTDVIDVARTMRDRDIGDVLVRLDDGRVGIVTDRDVVVRGVANDRDLGLTPVAEICTSDVATLRTDATIGDAVEMMRSRNVRRIPVMEDGQPAGIVSLGDLALEREPGSPLADISAAPPND